jgi:very-short-patch-repair endonuclease
MVRLNTDLAYRLDEMDFLVDVVHKFQGDERDLMIFSPVVSNGISDGALKFLSNNPYLFNVANTRARAALIVIGDYEAAINSGVDYLKEFALYVAKLNSEATNNNPTLVTYGPEYPPVSHPEKVSDWERVFYRKLYMEHIHPIPQYSVEQYTLDLAVFRGSKKLDIEIDGEQYHRDWNGEICRRDQIRNQRLTELGWDVMRFWVYQIRDDNNQCIERVQKWLDS